MNRFYESNYVSSIVPGALTAYDLPDLAASLAPRMLFMAGVTDGNGKYLDSQATGKELDFIQTTYKGKNADTQLKIVSLKPNEKLYDYLNEWIKKY
jgi:hypothetical protein